MYESRPLTESQPICRLCVDELPPMGQDVWLISKYGVGFKGAYHPEYDIIAWSPIPKPTEEQKQRLRKLGIID